MGNYKGPLPTMPLKIDGKKFILILLFAPPKVGSTTLPISGRTRLMKMGYLFEKEIIEDFQKGSNISFALPEFFAWKYGPFSTGLLKDLEFLINQEYVDVKLVDKNPIPEEVAEYKYWIESFEEFSEDDYSEEVFQLKTPKGYKKAEELWSELSDAQRRTVVLFKDSLTSAPLSRILEYVYRKYSSEGVTDKSLIRDRFLK